MSEISVRIPTSVMTKLSEIESTEGITKEQFINSAISEKLDAFLSLAYLTERAKRASRDSFLKTLDKAPDIAPDEFDKL
jgi:hypothetical protein